MKYLISFADSRYLKTLERVKSQAADMAVYDNIITYTEEDLDPDFKLKIGAWLRAKRTRGYGFWSWKPQIILQTLEKMEDGDLLQYIDAGCHLNIKGRKRLLEYFLMVEQSEKGILIFENKKPELPLIYDGRPLFEWNESMWCKGDLIEYLGVRGRDDILKSPVRGAGIIFMRKDEYVEKFIEHWRSIIYADFDLINDAPSLSPNEPDFVDHRHDQSIFSILSKLEGITDTVSAYEYFYPKNYKSDEIKYLGDWDALKQFPIHVRRDLN
jgi:hypothetical protein